LLGENVKKRIGSRTQSWVTPTLISWEEEENESDKEKKKNGGQKGRRKFWGVRCPRSQEEFQERGSSHWGQMLWRH